MTYCVDLGGKKGIKIGQCDPRSKVTLRDEGMKLFHVNKFLVGEVVWKFLCLIKFLSDVFSG